MIGEQATTGLRLQLATCVGSDNSSIFSIDRITAALIPIAANATIHLANHISLLGFVRRCTVNVTKSRVLAAKYINCTLLRSQNTANTR